MTNLQVIIESAFQQRELQLLGCADENLTDAIKQTIVQLGEGSLRIADKVAGEWVVHQWLKKAILLSFDLPDFNKPNQSIHQHVESASASICKSAYVAPTATMMPCYIGQGAHIDHDCRIGSWVTVGCGVQLGKKVQLCDGVVISNRLEPLAAKPTIIEDHCYIGARSVIADGVVIEQGSIIATGVNIDQSTRIYDRQSNATYHGRVPAGSVVVAGSLPDPTGTYSINAAIIVRTVDANTRMALGVAALLHAAL
ncbi:2,3,4,5-tetrahydropyridine-2,6-dicarboxylate N-succinyltransferase [Neiella marina]|uniref:2,3,4,5-tetrahydropyridine-2,6-dicarboxylate N-succinyltransferase n=1 Tax=Neiella marina TaxID=508461 RepID=A0A8J2U9R7_9GAMM|nr:DapH/DapD/GlmU-related protein [Neiella marina]GGA89293.1 2,3,4,5-tetrahydropyridine-2,6-dicarboxylate N-succinyltransferase [Neiella marina]